MTRTIALLKGLFSIYCGKLTRFSKFTLEWAFPRKCLTHTVARSGAFSTIFVVCVSERETKREHTVNGPFTLRSTPR